MSGGDTFAAERVATLSAEQWDAKIQRAATLWEETLKVGFVYWNNCTLTVGGPREYELGRLFLPEDSKVFYDIKERPDGFKYGLVTFDAEMYFNGHSEPRFQGSGGTSRCFQDANLASQYHKPEHYRLHSRQNILVEYVVRDDRLVARGRGWPSDDLLADLRKYNWIDSYINLMEIPQR
jgi:hypothetical protein